MYGFPLTIYVLSGFLGWDVPWLHESGHLWATLCRWSDLVMEAGRQIAATDSPTVAQAKRSP